MWYKVNFQNGQFLHVWNGPWRKYISFFNTAFRCDMWFNKGSPPSPVVNIRLDEFSMISGTVTDEIPKNKVIQYITTRILFSLKSTCRSTFTKQIKCTSVFLLVSLMQHRWCHMGYTGGNFQRNEAQRQCEPSAVLTNTITSSTWELMSNDIIQVSDNQKKSHWVLWRILISQHPVRSHLLFLLSNNPL